MKTATKRRSDGATKGYGVPPDPMRFVFFLRAFMMWTAFGTMLLYVVTFLLDHDTHALIDASQSAVIVLLCWLLGLAGLKR